MIDPEGEYSSLESLPGVVVFNDTVPPRLSDVKRTLRHPDTSIVIDLSALSHEKKLDYTQKLLPMLAKLRRESGLPHWLVVDEAHYFLNQSEAETVVGFERTATVLITYLPSQLHPDYLSANGTVISTTMTNPGDVAILTRLRGSSAKKAEWSQLISELTVNEAVIIHHTSSKTQLPQRFTLAPRLTSHVRHRSKYIDVPMPAHRAFHFTSNGQSFGTPARSLKKFVNLLDRVPVSSVEDHARRGDFSLWITKVLGDQTLASSIAKVEKQYTLGKVSMLSETINQSIQDRYNMPGL